MEEAERVSDLMDDDLSGDLVRAARADRVHDECDLAWIGAHIRLAAGDAFAGAVLNQDVDPARRAWTGVLPALQHGSVLSARPRRHGARHGIANHVEDVSRHRAADLIDGLKVKLRLLCPPLQRIRSTVLIVGSARQLAVEIHRERSRVPDQIERDVGSL